MDKSTPRSKSQVFITSFRSFELYFVPGSQEVVSQFQGTDQFSWIDEPSDRGSDDVS